MQVQQECVHTVALNIGEIILLLEITLLLTHGDPDANRTAIFSMLE